MKKYLFPFLLTITMLATSCGGGNTTATTQQDPGSTTPQVTDTTISADSVVQSDTTGGEETTTSMDDFVDYSEYEDAKLVQDYVGKDFFSDGIAQVSLNTPIDGDTAHFKMVAEGASRELIKSRFFGIDTPESTGQIQPYGKKASKYTTSMLQEANENGTIVVSSPFDDYRAPVTDSTGGRYVSLVWIHTSKKNAPFKELKLLNLLIVQEGYSWVKNVSDIPRLEPIFYEAEEQAKEYKLNLQSGEPDDGFNYGDYETTSLLDIKREIENHLIDPTYKNKYDGKKCRIVGTVSGYANNILYIQNFYNLEEGGNGSAKNEFLKEMGEYAGINFFTGAGTISSKYTKLGTYVELCGTCMDSDVFGFQMSGGKFSPYPAADDTENARVIIKATDNLEEYQLHEFEYKPEDLKNSDTSALYSPVKFTEPVKVTGGYKSNGAYTLYLSTVSGTKLPFDAYLPFDYIPDPDQSNVAWTVDQLKYKTFNLQGVYSYHESSGKIYYQVVARNVADFAEVK